MENMDILDPYDASSAPVEEVPEEVVAKLIWPAEDVQQLLENIQKNIPKNDNSKYSTAAKKLVWDEIKFKDYTANDCKSQWDLVLTRIRRYRTLNEVVGDAKDWAKNPYNNASLNKKVRHPDLPKKPLTPFLRYFTEKRERFAKKHPDSTSVVEMAKALAVSYRELSDKKKARYKLAFDQEYEEYKQKLEEFKKLHPDLDLSSHVKSEKQSYPGPVRPKTPFQMFLQKKTKDKIDSQNHDDGEFSKKDNLEQMRKAWSDLTDKKRLKWIKKSLADEKRYNQEVEEYKKTHADFEPPIIKVLNKAEKDLNQRAHGKPERPPCSGYAAFSKIMLKGKTDCSAKEKMTAIAQKWKELPAEEKNRYNQEAMEKQKDYSEKMKAYLESLSSDERELFLSEEKFKMPGEKKANRGKSSDLKDLPIQELAKDINIAAAAQCYYQAERLSILQAKHQEKSQSELTGQIIDEWSKMSLDKKEKYFRMVEGLTIAKKPAANKKAKLSDRLKGLSSAEIEIIDKLEQRLPRVPHKNPYSIFLTEKLAQLSNFEPKKRMAECSRLWHSVLTEEEKQHYVAKGKELQSAYEKEIKSFIKGLNSKERSLYEKYLKKPESNASLKRNRNGNEANNSKKVKIDAKESSNDEKADSEEDEGDNDDDDDEEEEEEEEEDDDDDDEDEEAEDEDDDDDDDEDEEEEEEEEGENDSSEADSSDDENREPAVKKSKK